MKNLLKLPSRPDRHSIYVVVESPKGSGEKLKFDPKLGVFLFSRALPIGVRYPFDWGFIPSTLDADGDPLDAMVLSDSSTAPGVVIACKPAGVIRMTQRDAAKRIPNDRIIAVPLKDARYNNLDMISGRTRKELETFFLSSVVLEDKHVRIEGWDGPKKAEALIERAERAYRQS